MQIGKEFKKKKKKGAKIQKQNKYLKILPFLESNDWLEDWGLSKELFPIFPSNFSFFCLTI